MEKDKIFTEEEIKYIENEWERRNLAIEQGLDWVLENQKHVLQIADNILKPYYSSTGITLAAWDEIRHRIEVMSGKI